MKLGIDAKWYFKGPPSGRVVVKNILDNMINLQDKDLELFVFIEKTNKKEAEKLWGTNEKIKLVCLPPLMNFLSNIFLVYFYGNYYKVDAVIFQNFSTFFSSKWKKIVYIHDLLFMDYPEYYSKKERWYFNLMLPLAKKADTKIKPRIILRYETDEK